MQRAKPSTPARDSLVPVSMIRVAWARIYIGRKLGVSLVDSCIAPGHWLT